MTIELRKAECLELLNRIAGGLASNPEFIKTTVQYRGYGEIGAQIAKKAKDAINEIMGGDYDFQ